MLGHDPAVTARRLWAVACADRTFQPARQVDRDGLSAGLHVDAQLLITQLFFELARYLGAGLAVEHLAVGFAVQ